MSLAVKNPTDPSYLTRLAKDYGAIASGSGGVTSKWCTHAALLLYSLSTYQTVAGTSTYTAGGIPIINGQQLNVIVVSNTAAGGAAAALGTTTIGPFIAGGGYVGAGTGTGQVGGINQFALNTTTGTAGYGGVPVPAQSMVYVVSGTDATAVNVCTIDYQVQFETPLTI